MREGMHHDIRRSGKFPLGVGPGRLPLVEPGLKLFGTVNDLGAGLPRRDRRRVKLDENTLAAVLERRKPVLVDVERSPFGVELAVGLEPGLKLFGTVNDLGAGLPRRDRRRVKLDENTLAAVLERRKPVLVDVERSPFDLRVELAVARWRAGRSG